jgi:hypothetical protein
MTEFLGVTATASLVHMKINVPSEMRYDKPGKSTSIDGDDPARQAASICVVHYHTYICTYIHRYIHSIAYHILGRDRVI